MERLTTNKPVEKMNRTELAYNCCFCKDGKAHYKDYDREIDAKEFARLLYQKYEGENLSTDDNEFDEEILEELQYNPEIYASALIALFYRNLWAMADMREKLKVYEDLEEQGLILRLPCKIGDTVYSVTRNFISEYTICSIEKYNEGLFFNWRCEKGIYINVKGFTDYDIGKIVFLTQEEAEQALEERNGV